MVNVSVIFFTIHLSKLGSKFHDAQIFFTDCSVLYFVKIKGRRGKWSIFVFAAGNGGDSGDSCAFNGYVNNIHTIAISGVNWDGAVPGYTEKCAAIMAVTYGKDTFSYRTDGYVKPPLVSYLEVSSS